MSPRGYQMQRRRAAADRTRARILAAARRLLLAPDSREFTMDAVAATADVSRLTVYYQFASKSGLLESLYDALASQARLGERLAGVFRPGNDPLEQMHDFLAVFVHFWASDRDVIRRLHAFGVIDAEIGEGLRVRNRRRRDGLEVLFGRLCRNRPSLARRQSEILSILHLLTSFETYDAFAGSGRGREAVLDLVRKLADQALGTGPSMSAEAASRAPRSRSRRRRSPSGVDRR